MNRYLVNVQKDYNSPIKTIVVEASTAESAAGKAERANPIVTNVRRASCDCGWECICS